MPKGMTDPIASILKEYERDPARNEKKAVLLTPQGGYFLYGTRFCSISDYELEFQSDSCRIQGKSVQAPIFLGVLHDRLHAVGERPYKPELVDLIFHIDLELIPKLFYMDRNELAPDNNSASKLKEGKVVGSFFLKANQ